MTPHTKRIVLVRGIERATGVHDPSRNERMVNRWSGRIALCGLALSVACESVTQPLGDDIGGAGGQGSAGAGGAVVSGGGASAATGGGASAATGGASVATGGASVATGGAGASAGANATNAGGSGGKIATSAAGDGGNGPCDLTTFIDAVVAARAASSAPSGCAAPFSLPITGSAQQTTGQFVATVLELSRASLSMSTEHCGDATSAACSSTFDLAVGAAGGNLMAIVHPFSVELESCALGVQQSWWSPTTNGVSGPAVACLAGTSSEQVLGICIFESPTTCPP